MYEDPIVKGIHEIRERFAAKFNYDTQAMLRHLRQQQAKSGRPVVTRKPKTPHRKTNAA